MKIKIKKKKPKILDSVKATVFYYLKYQPDIKSAELQKILKTKWPDTAFNSKHLSWYRCKFNKLRRLEKWK